MIETAMLFALGFLVASLSALLFLPAVNARAVRLARRRVDASMPLSMRAVTAEKDQLRAEFAVARRRLERAVDEVRAKRHADLAAIGARTLEIAALSRNLEAREAVLREREVEIAAALARIERLDHDLKQAREEGSASLATLHALEEAHRDLLDDLKTTRRERDSIIRRDVADLAAQDPANGRAGMDEATELAELKARQTALVAEREGLQASLNAAEEALARTMADHGEAIERDNAELRARITEVADTLTRRERLPVASAFPAPAAARS